MTGLTEQRWQRKQEELAEDFRSIAHDLEDGGAFLAIGFVYVNSDGVMHEYLEARDEHSMQQLEKKLHPERRF